jgi:hypothetical protein
MSYSSASARAAERRHLMCAVQRCDKHVSGLSHYCNTHKQNLARHGDPLAHALRACELAPYLKQVHKFLAANEDHPALVESYKGLDEWLQEGSRQAAMLTPEVAKHWRGRMASECRRLHAAGVTGRVLFERIAAVWLLSGADTRRLPRHSKPHRFAVARAVFNLADRFGKRALRQNNEIKKITKRLSTELLNNAGRELTVSFLPVLLKIEDAIGARERREAARRDKLVAAVAQKDFASV